METEEFGRAIDMTTLDRFERWRETTCDSIPVNEREKKRHLYSFGWWPDAQVLRSAEFGYRCREANDGRFWKNGDIRSAEKYLMQLEIALRYGPFALDVADIDGLADAIENYIDHVPFPDEKIDLKAPGNIIALLFSGADKPQDNKPWDLLDKAYQDTSKRALTYLVPDWIDSSPHHPDDIKHVVAFCAAAGVSLLDDAGWLMADWRNMAIRAYVHVLGLD